VYRVEELARPGHNVKSIHDTERVLSLHLHHHRHISLLNDSSKEVGVSPEMALLHHYKTDCQANNIKNCTNFLKDPSIWRFKDELVDRTLKSIYMSRRQKLI
jgi:hypothetical protein